MPKNSKKKIRKGGGGPAFSVVTSKPVRYPFRVHSSIQGGVSATALVAMPITAAGVFGNRAALASTTFSHWRLIRLKVTSMMSCGGIIQGTYQSQSGAAGTLQYTANGAWHAVGYTNVDSTKLSATPTFDQASQLPCWSVANGYNKATFVVPHAELRKTTPLWLETSATGSESEAFRQAGTIWHGINVDHTVAGDFTRILVIEGIVEFCDPIDQGVDFTKQVVPYQPRDPSDEEKKSDVDDDERDFLEWLRIKNSSRKTSAVPLPLCAPTTAKP